MVNEQNWKEQYEGQLILWKEVNASKPSLRFDSKYVIPSKLGEQLYCEKKGRACEHLRRSRNR